MFKWIKRFFGLDYPNLAATGTHSRPPVEGKGEILLPTTAVTRPAVEGKGEILAVKKAAPKKKPAKKAVKK